MRLFLPLAPMFAFMATTARSVSSVRVRSFLDDGAPTGGEDDNVGETCDATRSTTTDALENCHDLSMQHTTILSEDDDEGRPSLRQVAPGPTILCDDFNRADGSLGADWSANGNIFIVSQEVDHNFAEECCAFTEYTAVPTNGQRVRIDVTAFTYNSGDFNVIALLLGRGGTAPPLFLKVQAQNSGLFVGCEININGSKYVSLLAWWAGSVSFAHICHLGFLSFEPVPHLICLV
jgi:hypothetical protein